MGTGLAFKVVDDWQGSKADWHMHHPPAINIPVRLLSLRACRMSFKLNTARTATRLYTSRYDMHTQLHCQILPGRRQYLLGGYWGPHKGRVMLDLALQKGVHSCTAQQHTSNTCFTYSTAQWRPKTAEVP